MVRHFNRYSIEFKGINRKLFLLLHYRRIILPMNPLKPASSLSFDYVEEWEMLAINSQFHCTDFLFMKSILPSNVC